MTDPAAGVTGALPRPEDKGKAPAGPQDVGGAAGTGGVAADGAGAEETEGAGGSADGVALPPQTLAALEHFAEKIGDSEF